MPRSCPARLRTSWTKRPEGPRKSHHGQRATCLRPLPRPSAHPADLSRPALARRPGARVPDWIYTDQRIYDREQERDLRWRDTGATSASRPSYLIPGDYIRSYMGSVPIDRGARQAWRGCNAFENRCAHRGAEFCQDLPRQHQALHLPLSPMELQPRRFADRRSVQEVALQRQRRHAGRLQDTKTIILRRLQSGGTRRRHLRHASTITHLRSRSIWARRCWRSSTPSSTASKLKLLGIHRNTLPGNWKLYQENLKDPYHATLLHTYLTTFGLFVAGNRTRDLRSTRPGLHSALMNAKPKVAPDAGRAQGRHRLVSARHEAGGRSHPRLLSRVRVGLFEQRP